MTRAAQLRSAAACALFLLSACASLPRAAFDLSAADNTPAGLARIAGARPEPGEPTQDWVLVREDGERGGLRLLSPSGGPSWRRELTSDSRPMRHGDVVIASRAQVLHVLSAADGSTRFEYRMPYPSLLGSDRAGTRLFITSSTDKAPQRAALTALDLATGRVLFERAIDGRLGAPSAAQGLVLVPWNAQFLVALDPDSGRELARLRSRDSLFTFCHVRPDGVYAGDRRIQRLTESFDGTSESLPGLTLATDDLPGAPAPYPSAFAPEPGARSAYGRVGLHFDLEAAADGSPSLGGGRSYLVFFRHVYALDSQGVPLWGRVLDADVVAARAQPNGLALLSEQGHRLLLDGETGTTLADVSLAPELSIGSARMGDVAWKADPGAPARAPVPLREQLLSLAIDPDNRLVPSREFALRHLARQSDPEVTRDLLDLYRQSTTPIAMKKQVAASLLTRTGGERYLLEALQLRYDFLDQTRPAPLQLIVPALVKLGATQAVPPLLARLFDHETDIDDLPMLVDAIGTLGGASAMPALARFVDRYRADSVADQRPEAFVRAVELLARLGDQGEQAHLRALAADPRTVSPLREPLLALLAPNETPAVTAPSPPAVATPQLPPRLSQSEINAVFADMTDDLRACVLDELGRHPELARVRVAFVLDAAGRARTRAYVPNSDDFVACLDPKVAALRFPHSAARQQLASYTVALHEREEAEPDQPHETDAWWAAYVRPTTSTPAGPPWWRDQNPLTHDVERAYRRADDAEETGPAASPASRETKAPVTTVAPAVGEPAPRQEPKSGRGPAANAPEPATTPEPAPSQDAWWLPNE